VLLGLGIVWIAVTGYLASRQARDISTRLQQIRILVSQGDTTEAQVLATDVAQMADRLDRLTSGPAWWIGSSVPWIGDPLESIRSIASASDEVGSHVVPVLAKEIPRIDPASLRVRGDTYRLAPLAQALPGLEQADNALLSAKRKIDDAPSSTWLSLVDNKHKDLASQISQIEGYVAAATRVARIAPTMMGSDHPQTYFIGLQNEAELRGTGGLPGAWAIGRTDHGTVHFTQFGSDTALQDKGKHHLIPTGLDFGSDYNSAYGASQPTESFVDSNVSPNFPYTAQIWAAMWQKVTGQRVDGVVALDPTVLSYFLRVAGPIVAKYHVPVTADNVVSVTQKDEYALFPSNVERKPFLVSVLRATAHEVTSGSGKPVSLVRAASQAAIDHRLLIWSRYPSIERVLEQTNYSGAIPQNAQPFSGLVLNNASGGKLDYYLQRTVNYQRAGCSSTSDVSVTISLTNVAPAAGLSPYVTSRLDTPPPGAQVGDYKTLLDYYATVGAKLQSITVDGRPSTATVEQAFGHPIFRVEQQLPRGTTQTIVLHLQEPRGMAAPRIWRQPGVTPVDVDVSDQPC
jgi:hypothetical protein